MKCLSVYYFNFDGKTLWPPLLQCATSVRWCPKVVSEKRYPLLLDFVIGAPVKNRKSKYLLVDKEPVLWNRHPQCHSSAAVHGCCVISTLYEHFSVAMHILSPTLCHHYCDYVEELLRVWVKDDMKLNGKQFDVYNVPTTQCATSVRRCPKVVSDSFLKAIINTHVHKVH